MEGELLDGLVVAALGGDKLIDGIADFLEHIIAQQALFQNLAIHQVLAHGRADGAGDACLLLGNDAGGKGHVDAHDVFGLVRPEQHADGNVVGDVADNGSHSGTNQIMIHPSKA